MIKIIVCELHLKKRIKTDFLSILIFGCDIKSSTIFKFPFLVAMNKGVLKKEMIMNFIQNKINKIVFK